MRTGEREERRASGWGALSHMTEGPLVRQYSFAVIRNLHALASRCVWKRQIFNRSLVRAVSAPLKFPCDRPDTCNSPRAPRRWWSQVVVAALERRRAEYLFLYSQPIPLQACVSCLQSCVSSRGGWPWWLTEPHLSNCTGGLKRRSM